MDQLLKQLAAAAQAHTQAPLMGHMALAGLTASGQVNTPTHSHAASALQLYAAAFAAGWAPFLGLNAISSSSCSPSSNNTSNYRPGACGSSSSPVSVTASASAHMLRHMALLQRCTAAAASKLQEVKEHEDDEEEEEEVEIEVESLEQTTRNVLQAEANEASADRERVCPCCKVAAMLASPWCVRRRRIDCDAHQPPNGAEAGRTPHTPHSNCL
ncbi:hypothetical protein ACLKA6_001240 [Drosophila palustris]